LAATAINWCLAENAQNNGGTQMTGYDWINDIFNARRTPEERVGELWQGLRTDISGAALAFSFKRPEEPDLETQHEASAFVYLDAISRTKVRIENRGPSVSVQLDRGNRRLGSGLLTPAAEYGTWTFKADEPGGAYTSQSFGSASKICEALLTPFFKEVIE
jgi:hypothetical protein